MYKKISPFLLIDLKKHGIKAGKTTRYNESMASGEQLNKINHTGKNQLKFLHKPRIR